MGKTEFKGKILYSRPNTFQTLQCLIVAKYSNVTLDFVPVTNTSSIKDRYIIGTTLPVLTDESVTLSGLNAVSWYLNEEKTKNLSKIEISEILCWLTFSNVEVAPLVSNWVLPILGSEFKLHNVKEVMKASKKEITSILSSLNGTMLHKTFLVGERISLADISLFCAVLPLYQFVLDPQLKKPYVNFNRWFNTVLHQPYVNSIVGKIQVCEKEPEYIEK